MFKVGTAGKFTGSAVPPNVRLRWGQFWNTGVPKVPSPYPVILTMGIYQSNIDWGHLVATPTG